MAERTSDQDRGAIQLEWDFPEYAQYTRGRGWYLTFFAAVIGFGTFAVLSQNYPFLMIIIVATVVLVSRLRRQALIVRFRIYEDGVSVSDRFYRWDEFKEFYILYKPPEVKRLFLDFKGSLRPTLDISLEGENPLRVRQVISPYLPENVAREDEPLSDQWARMLKL